MNTKYGLIFDVDGVIADTEGVNARATIKVFERLFGITGVKREDFEDGLGRGAEAYVQAAASVHGRILTQDQLKLATEERQAEFLKILEQRPLPAFPGVLRLMNSALKNHEFGVAIATSSTREKSEAVLRSADIPYDQTVYITGSDVNNKKPDPELFLLAVERLRVPADSCVVIEDAPDGVRAALAAGCKCVAVTNSTNRINLGEADHIVDSIEKLSIIDLVELIKGR